MKTKHLIFTFGALCILLTGGGCTTQPSGTTTTPPTSTPQTTTIEYKNTDYNFTFKLPKSWEGYTIVKSNWEGMLLDQNNKKVTGPELAIRNPHWTAKNPYQDIPVMIFTPDQWNLIQSEKLSVSAAPIGPSELGHNTHYIFALPARYNFAYPTGWEEVEKIITSNIPLTTF
jgi:hypothetical protein